MIHRRSGFTLIELLVVIAIIAILAAILFPVFAQARAKARQAACMSNLKQLGISFQMYAQDHDEMLPAWGYGVAGTDNSNGPPDFFSWDTVLEPYLKNQQILKCPDNPYDRNARSYAMTRYTGDPYGVNIPLHMASAPLPSETVLLSEKGKHAPGIAGDAAMEAFYQSYSATPWNLETDMFHNGGKNFLFLDGHVKWFKENAGPFANDAGQNVEPSDSNLYAGWDNDKQPFEPDRENLGLCEFWFDLPGS